MAALEESFMKATEDKNAAIAQVRGQSAGMHRTGQAWFLCQGAELLAWQVCEVQVLDSKCYAAIRLCSYTR